MKSAMNMSAEQEAELKEKLSKMSPAEIMEMQKQQCIFCHIISGKVPARTVYEDNKVKVILDIQPAGPGHCLIIPKEHYMVLPQMPHSEVNHVFVVAKYLSQALLRAIKADGVSWFVANGAVAGQRAQHAMVHMIPRIDNDNIGLFLPKGTVKQDVAALLKTKLASVKQPKKFVSATSQKNSPIFQSTPDEQKSAEKDSNEKESSSSSSIDDIAKFLAGK